MHEKHKGEDQGTDFSKARVVNSRSGNTRYDIDHARTKPVVDRIPVRPKRILGTNGSSKDMENNMEHKQKKRWARWADQEEGDMDEGMEEVLEMWRKTNGSTQAVTSDVVDIVAKHQNESGKRNACTDTVIPEQCMLCLGSPAWTVRHCEDGHCSTSK